MKFFSQRSWLLQELTFGLSAISHSFVFVSGNEGEKEREGVEREALRDLFAIVLSHVKLIISPLSLMIFLPESAWEASKEA